MAVTNVELTKEQRDWIIQVIEQFQVNGKVVDVAKFIKAAQEIIAILREST
jgi:hypothetical protein